MFVPKNENRDMERPTDLNGKLAKGTQEISDRYRAEPRLMSPSLFRMEVHSATV
jgi:hypothetical protein